MRIKSTVLAAKEIMMENVIYVGIDLHKTQFTICAMADSVVLDEGTKYPASHEGMTAFAAYALSFRKHVILAIESTGNSRHFRDIMESYGFEVVVVNTLRFKIVNESTKKTDSNDARTLCEFLSKDMLPQSHLCSAQNEELRRILKTRSILVQNTVAFKNQAHAVLLAHGIITQQTQFQSRKKRHEFCLSLPPHLRDTIGILFEGVDNCQREIRRLEKYLRAYSKDDQETDILMTIPGIGIVNACTIKAYTDDINRFETYKNYCAYCGLVPWVQSSNEKTHLGHITKRGPLELRNAMVQCVVGMIRMPEKTEDFRIVKQYYYLKEQKNSGKAIIATARKLARIVYTMLTTNRPFDSARMIE